MAESCMTSSPRGETVHEGVGTEELDPNFSSSSLYLLGIVNQSQNASFGVEDSMFRPNSPTFRQVLELVYQRSAELTPGGKEGPGVWEVVDTVRNCMFQTDEGGVGNEHEVLLHSLSVQLELQKSPGDFLTRDNFNLAMESWIYSVSSYQREHSVASSRSDQFSNPLEQTHSLTGSYSLEGTGGGSNSGRDADNLSERVEELLRYTGQLERENNLLRQQVLESEDTISDLTEIRERLERQLAELRIALHNNQSLTLENSALKQELTKLDSSLSHTKQRLFQETKHRQTLESELESCHQDSQPLLHTDTYVMESYVDSIQEPVNEMAELQDKLEIATSELNHLYEDNEHLQRRISFLTDKNEELCQQIEDLEQMGHESLYTPSAAHNSTPPRATSYHTPTLEQELSGIVYSSPKPNGVKFCSSTPLGSVHLVRESIFDVSNSSLELLESLSTDPNWKELCSLKSAQSDLIAQKTNEIMSDIQQLDSGQEYSSIIDQFRAKHRQLQSELEASLQLRGETEREAALLQGEVARLKDEVSRLQQQLEELLQTKSHGDTLIAELSTKDDVIKQLSDELQNLSQKLNPNEPETARISTFEERRSSLCAENAKLLACIQEKSNLINQLTTERDQAQYELNDVTKQLETKTQELDALEANRVDIEDKLNVTAQQLTNQNEETRVAILAQEQALAELTTQQANATVVVDQLRQSETEFESFRREHTSCLQDLWCLSQPNSGRIDPFFTPTAQQVKHAIIQRIQAGSPGKHVLHSPTVSPSRDSNTLTSLSLTPTAFPTPPNNTASPTHNLSSLEEKVRAIQIWFSSARYTTKPTCLAWKQHLNTLEATIYGRMTEIGKLLVSGDCKQAVRLLKSLRNSVSVLSNSSLKVGGLEHECWDLDNYRVLLEYIECLKRSPCASLGDNRAVRRDTPCRNEDPLIEGREREQIERRLFETQKDIFPDFQREIEALMRKEKSLQKRADELTQTVKSIKPVRKGVTFRGILLNFHLSLSLFFLLVVAYLLIGQFPSSLPIIRHKLVFGPAFSFSKYFIDTSEYTPIT